MKNTSTECAPVGGLATGWFGIPGGPECRSTLVHVVSGGKPVCGTRLSVDQEFQWCSHGVFAEQVECRRCKEWVARLRAAGWQGGY